jgi:hypothetical protein
MEERINKLEKIVERLMRRSGKRHSAFITPYPISTAVFGEKLSDGPVLRYMFPCDGVLTKGIIRLGSRTKNPIAIKIKIFNESDSVAKGYTMEKVYLSIQPNLNVYAGDCLEIDLVVYDEIVSELWISLLWKPSTDNTEVKTFLIEDLENDLQERTKALTAE